jgi:hypothetical protein
VAVAEPNLIGRVIAAWPSFALTASYELLTRQVRLGASRLGRQANHNGRGPRRVRRPGVPGRLACGWCHHSNSAKAGAGYELQRRAWQWVLANGTADSSLPSGSAIARAHGRKERRGRLVKSVG